jgi:hypothetical protein
VNICSFKQHLPGRGFILHHSLPMIVHCRIFKFGTRGPETPSHPRLLRRLLSESASEQPPSPRQDSDAPAAAAWMPGIRKHPRAGREGCSGGDQRCRAARAWTSLRPLASSRGLGWRQLGPTRSGQALTFRPTRTATAGDSKDDGQQDSPG